MVIIGSWLIPKDLTLRPMIQMNHFALESKALDCRRGRDHDSRARGREGEAPWNLFLGEYRGPSGIRVDP